jgi:transglutaminase-like putative cysteine protease
MLTTGGAAGTTQHQQPPPRPAFTSTAARPAAPPPPWPFTAEQEGYPATTLSLTVLTLASAAGLLRVFTNDGWIGPVLVTALALHGVGWVSRRWRVPQVAAMAISVLVLWFLVGWTVLPSSTYHGLPAAGTASHVWAAWMQAHADFAAAVTPVTTTTGYTLLAVLGTGAVAILGDWAAFRWRSALYAVAPAFAYFVVCSILGEGPGREWTVALEVTAILVFLVLHRATVDRSDQAWFGNQRTGAVGWAVRAGCAAAAASLLAALVFTPLAGGTEGRGVFGWRGGFGDVGSGPRQVPNPVVDLHTRILQQFDTKVFQVQSTVPSYWRLTSLDTFTGQDWVSTNSYRTFSEDLPGAQAVPPGTRTVRQTFQVQALDSVWLPDSFTPVAVSGVRHVSYDPVSGSLITSRPTSNGLTYTVTSYQFLSALNPAKLEKAPPVASAGAIKRYLLLPKSVPQEVKDLAQRITAGQTTEYGKALALQNYFWDPANGFLYNLNPPGDGYGIAALTNFLFSTKQGYCQQFAGAYAVLARAIGLPTRLAVGFITGTEINSTGTYQVTDGDAHTWPEVYFGPKYGWLPFEPTKTSVDPPSQGYAPTPAESTGGGAQVPSSPFPAIPKGLQIPPGLGAGGGGAGAAAAGNQAANQTTGHHRSAAWSVFLIILAVFGIWSAVVTVVRRGGWLIRRWRARGDPAALVRSYWADATEMLGWWGGKPARGETDQEFAERAGRLLVGRLRDPAAWLPGGVRRLGRMATEAAFAPSVPPQRVREAKAVTREIHQGLFRSATARQLLVWALIPRPGLRPGTGLGQVLGGPPLGRDFAGGRPPTMPAGASFPR